MGQILIGVKLSVEINILRPVVQPALMLTKCIFLFRNE